MDRTTMDGRDMRILERWESLVFTHFVTDGQRLPGPRVRAIEDAVVPRLRARGIVVGIHFEHGRDERGIRVVLECRPRPADLDAIQRELALILAPIPVRPAVTPCTGEAAGARRRAEERS